MQLPAHEAQAGRQQAQQQLLGATAQRLAQLARQRLRGWRV
jgi:hypothetical protein